MIGVREGSSNLVAISIIQNVLDLNVALFLVRVIGQRTRDLIGKLIGRILDFVGNRIRLLRLLLLFSLRKTYCGTL